ncbi:unnamed protein product [Moneuplotes crassus]|uniref:TLDc domain-containing protein n=1 Tax=Euplotes crassus TaxID=5936 RepID=A0AAD2D847_EUPCR|nr:unnamed protein product [Moneuplotes crassus]
MLKDLMEKELAKSEKEIESFGKEFENLVESCRYTITQKYKKLACEISKNILNQDPELLINSTKHASKDTTELFNRLSACIQNCQRDSNNFEYQFNFFKNRLISVYNIVLYKIPKINLNNNLSNFEEEQSRKSLRDMLQSMTGVVFENSVPLSEDNTQSSLSKLESMVNSLRLSKILKSNEQKSDFAYKILIKNNYEQLTPLWGKIAEDSEDISAEEFHEHCDKQGSILILVKTKNGCVFGGVSPLGFDSINNYFGSEYAFLFSYATPTGREPIICKIKPEKASFAVKNNEAKYSPGFGQSNKSDLFISFKNLSKSYSHIGSVYEFPKEFVKDEEGYNTPETFFTGLTTNWRIENIEVFSIGE